MISWPSFFFGVAFAYSPRILAFAWVCFTLSGDDKSRGRASEPEVREIKGRVISLDHWRRRA